LIEKDESYTSKCDALLLESVKKHKKYSGNREKRGLFRSGTGQLLNADINGAINILRKWYESEKDIRAMEEINEKFIFNQLIVDNRCFMSKLTNPDSGKNKKCTLGMLSSHHRKGLNGKPLSVFRIRKG